MFSWQLILEFFSDLAQVQIPEGETEQPIHILTDIKEAG